MGHKAWPGPSSARAAPPGSFLCPKPAPPGHTTLLSWTSGLMVNWTTNHVALRRMKAAMRFQWMVFLRHRMLLGAAGEGQPWGQGEGREGEGQAASTTPAQMYGWGACVGLTG